jgi:tetratricopeptide (TPR) repeat protein
LLSPITFGLRDVGDVALAEERQQVVLAEAVEVDVLDDHHLVIIDGEQRAVETASMSASVAARQEAQRLLDALRRVEQPLARRVLPELPETQGIRAGLRYRAPVKEALERVLAIEPGFLDGSADRALGRWYFKVPGLFGGSKQKSLEHLQRSLSYDPTNHASNFFLAETLFSLHRLDEAVAALRRVIEAPVHPEWEAEDLEFKQRAHYRLEGLAWKQSRPR